MKTNVTLPIVHLNGTGIKMLRETYDAPAELLHDFIEAWGQTEFNSRDYYVSSDPDCWNKAVKEREEMNSKIRDLKNYLQAIREHLYTQKD